LADTDQIWHDYGHIVPGNKRKVGTATYTNLTWEKSLQRGSVGQSELGAAALHKAIWWDLHLCKPADTFVLLNCTLKLILLQQLMLLFMATLRSRYGHYVFALWFLLSSFFFFNA